jgi:hypothetical protein
LESRGGAAPVPEIPLEGERLWEIFWALSRRRSSAYGGPNPLSPTDVRNWCEQAAEPLSPWEFRVICAMDDVRMEATGVAPDDELSRASMAGGDINVVKTIMRSLSPSGRAPPRSTKRG